MEIIKHITFQGCTVIFNVQFIVLSSLEPTATFVISVAMNNIDWE